MNYYAGRAIREPVCRGAELRGICDGSQDKPYRVKVSLRGNGIREASCTCPRGGFCKHIVALLLTYVHTPDAFGDIHSLETKLAACKKEDLITLIGNMVQRDTSLLPMVERMIVMPAGAHVDVALLRREMQRALRREDHDDMENDLRDLLQTAENLAQKEDWPGAGTVYQEVLGVLTSVYEDELHHMDEEGNIAAIAGDCVEGLRICLDESEGDSPARQDWLAALMEAGLADIMMGGIDFAADALDIVLDHATDAEWILQEERVRELIPENDGWTRERLVNILVTRLEMTGRHDEASGIMRELGTISQVMFLLAREGKPGEAIALAREHFSASPGIIIDLVRTLAGLGSAEHAVTLLTQLVNSEKPYKGYLEWLADYYRTNGDLAAALKWQRTVFLSSPDVKSFTKLHEVSERLEVWEEVRAGVLKVLADKNKVPSLIEIALHEGDVDRALALLNRLPPNSWRNYRAEVANAAEEKRPLEAIALYREMAEAAIAWRQRKNYRQAAEYLHRMKMLYERLGNRGEWEKYLAGLKKTYANFRALQDEFANAGL
ncbi:MAG: SWIM zinc finger family protein [Dethiobacter sp.]|nr:SWIM zinc finger family protein [Dethiobacter sp.]